MKKIILLILVISLFSCAKEIETNEIKTKEKITEDYYSDNFERIGFPVKLHFIKKSGMNYLIASGSYGESGCAIANLTLDSLKVEFYKKNLGR